MLTMIVRTGFVSVEELAHSRRLAKAQKVMATLTHRAHRKLEREGAMENLSSGASEAGPIEALSLRDQELMKMEARQVVDEWLRPEFRGSAAAASHEAAWGPVGAFCPSRLFRFFVVSSRISQQPCVSREPRGESKVDAEIRGAVGRKDQRGEPTKQSKPVFLVGVCECGGGRMQALEKNPLFAPGATEHYLLLAKNRTRSSTSPVRSEIRALLPIREFAYMRVATCPLPL